MEKYSSYKDSGVKWLGEIPSHWETRTLKYCCSLKGRIGWNGLRSEEFQYSSYAYLVTGQDFIGSEINWSKCYQISQERYDEDPYIQLNNGDMLITKDGTIGKVAKVTNLDKPACLNSGIFVIKQKGTYFNQGFLYWMLCSNVLKEFNIYTQTGATIAHLYQNVFENMPCILPPLSEQNAIASYLDSVTTQIDVAIAQQKKMIELLNERKQIIINNAVTKGLDPNVNMKDSGVDWIGEIPEGWEVRKTLFCLSMPITDGPHETPQLHEDGIPFVSAEAVSCGNGRIDFDHIRGYISKEFYNECCKKYIPKLHDIYMIKSGATTGKVALVDTDRIFTIWSPLAVFRCDESIMYYDYMFYVLQSTLYQQQVQLGWSYGTQQNIGMRTLEKLKVPVPPINVQKGIAYYIIDKCKPIDDAICIANKQTTLLQERKQIIINEVVTGKVKVV